MESLKETRSFNVTGGPSRDNLFEAVKRTYSGLPKCFEFDIQFDETHELNTHNMRLTGIKHQDESGHRFIIEGSCWMTFSPYTTEMSHLHSKKFTMTYDTNESKGTIEFPVD
jgi:hypothetical protein